MRDGEVNLQFGIYKNICCGAEIVIPEGVTFPQCAKHVSTEWKDIIEVDFLLHDENKERKTPASKLNPLGELAELLHQNRS
jgi:hypothetical protein